MDNKNTINKKGREVMNIYEKTQKMRCELQDKNLKKSGKNPFAKYEYFELQDIIPTINKLMEKHKTTSVMSYDKEMAILKIINSEKPDEVMTFTCPVEMAILKGCHNTQNLGATITYIRRYLYINAFEIVEHDVLDRIPQDNTKTRTETKPAYKKPEPAQTANQANTQEPDKSLISEPQRKRLYAIGKNAGWKDEEMKELVATFGYEHSKDIKRDDYNKICEMLEKGTTNIPHGDNKQKDLLKDIKDNSDENVKDYELDSLDKKVLEYKKQLHELTNDDITYGKILDKFEVSQPYELKDKEQKAELVTALANAAIELQKGGK